MAEDGIQDFIGILNVTMKGIENAGKATKFVADAGFQVAKGGYKALAKIIKLLTWIFRTISEKQYYKTGGEVKNKVLQTKFQDLTYNEFKLSNIGERIRAKGDPNINVEYVEKMLNEDVLKKKIEILSRKCGFLYAKVPNFVLNEETGKPEFRIAFSKQQMDAYNEVRAQIYAYMDKVLDDAGMEKKEERANIINEALSTPKPLMSAMDEIGVTAVSNEVLDAKMKETYPDYDPAEFTPVEPTEEKKTASIEITENNEYARESAKGNVKEINFTKVLLKTPSEQSVTVVLDEYPNAAIKIKESDVLDLRNWKDEKGTVGYKMAIKKDATYEFEVYHVNPITKKVDFAQNPKHYEMTFKEFERMMAENAEKTKAKVTNLLEQKSMLPAAPKPNTPRKNK